MLQPTSFFMLGPICQISGLTSCHPTIPLPLYPSTPLVCTQCLGFSATLPPGQVRLFYVTGAEQRVVRAKETKKEKRWTP